MFKNLDTLIKEEKERLEKFAQYEEVGDEVSDEESEMFAALNNAIECIDAYLEKCDRKEKVFEKGVYLTNSLEQIRVVRIGENSIWVNKLGRDCRLNKICYTGREKTRGIYDIQA